MQGQLLRLSSLSLRTRGFQTGAFRWSTLQNSFSTSTALLAGPELEQKDQPKTAEIKGEQEKDWNSFALTLLGAATAIPIAVCSGYVWSYPLYHPVASKAIFVQMTLAQTILATSGGIKIGEAISNLTPREGSTSPRWRKLLVGGMMPVSIAWTSSQLPPEIGMACLIGGYGISLGVDI